MSRRLALALMLGAATAGCHTTLVLDTTRAGRRTHTLHPEGAIAHKPTLVLSDIGTLRFVQPLECPTEDVIAENTTTELITAPNYATFIVGVLATGLGGVALAHGALGGNTSGDPFTYVGVAGVAIGLPLLIGPFLGTHTDLREGPPAPALSRPGPSEPCGERPFAARTATLALRGLEIHGSVAIDGTFSISPYALVDAYQTRAIAALDVTALVDADDGARTVSAVLDAGALASHAAAFLAHADFDAHIEPMRLVPDLSAGPLRVGLTSTVDGPALRVVLPLHNDGPGDAWAVRGQLTSSVASIDGRMIYVGHLARGEDVARELLIPLTARAAAAIRGGTLDISIELRDGHDTAPSQPVRFHGAVASDVPRS